jgi:hypothetical protein
MLLLLSIIILFFAIIPYVKSHFEKPIGDSMTKFILIAFFASITHSAFSNEPVIGGPCQGCEFVFQDIPSQIPPNARIAALDEEGEPMIVSGTVFNKDGTIAEGVVIYAYQTNNKGNYPKGDTFHGRLRAWAKTNSDGRYVFETIRPVAYPNREEPEHIHLHVIEKNRGTYYIDSIEFTDDILLTNDLKKARKSRGGNGVVTPVKNKLGQWLVTRDVDLGTGIPNYIE